MADSLYIGTMGPRSGKTFVLLGILELLSRRVGRLGVFRPIIPNADEPDNDIELAQKLFGIDLPYESMYALTHDEVSTLLKDGPTGAVLKQIFNSYRELRRRCDFVVCIGTDYVADTSALEFNFNSCKSWTWIY